MALTKHQSSRLLYTKLELRDKLHLCTTKSSQSDLSAYFRMPSNINNNCSRMGISTMVANIGKFKLQVSSSSQLNSSIYSSIKWLSGTFKQPELEIPSS